MLALNLTLAALGQAQCCTDWEQPKRWRRSSIHNCTGVHLVPGVQHLPWRARLLPEQRPASVDDYPRTATDELFPAPVLSQ